MQDKKYLFKRRKQRIRQRLRRAVGNRPRLSVFRSNRHIYAQIIDDAAGRTLAAASSLEKAVQGECPKSWDTEAASAVGRLIAERAQSAEVVDVVFDRGGCPYHGRVKALGDAARDAGLNF